jgi:hypothetical protein
MSLAVFIILIVIGIFAFNMAYDPSIKSRSIRESDSTIYQLSSTPDESTPDESTPDESTPDESTPDESTPSQSNSPIPLKVTVNNLSSITIQSDILTSPSSYLAFELFQDEELTIPFSTSLITVDVIATRVVVHENSVRDNGFVWSNIDPPFAYSTRYWMYVTAVTDETGDYNGALEITTVSFMTISEPEDTTTQTFMDELEDGLRKLGEFLLQFAVEEAFEMLLDILKDPRNTARWFIELFDSMKAKMKARADVKSAHKLAGTTELEKSSFRFLLFMDIFKFNPEDVAKITGGLPETMSKMFKFLENIDLNDVMARSKNGIKYGAQGLKKLATSIGTNLLKAGAAVGKFAAGMLTPDPLDIVLLGLSLAGAALESENKGGMMDWNNLKTSDFLSMKEESIKNQVHFFRSPPYNITQAPLINGPLLKYDNKTLFDLIEELSQDLFILPPLKSRNQNDETGYDFFLNSLSSYPNFDNTLRAYYALSRNGNIRNQTDIDYIENLQVMRDLRSVQKMCINSFVTKYNEKKQQLINAGITNPLDAVSLWASDTGFENYTKTYIGNLPTIKKISVYIFCKMNGGNPLGNGQCSYTTPSACFNSYPWPLPRPQFSVSAGLSSSTKPRVSPVHCSPSPCLETESSSYMGITDHFYSEWRYPDGIERDFKNYTTASSPIWTDPNVTNPNIDGACIIYNPSVRQLCEASTKLDDRSTDVRNYKVIARNDYNRYTGECTNTRAFCDAYGVSYRSDMPVSEMAYRGSGPLPSCYWSDAQKAGSMILGSDIIVQYFERFADIMEDGWRTFVGLLNGRDPDEEEAEKRRERLRQIAESNAMMISQSEEAQQEIFDKFYGMSYILSTTAQCVDFKISPLDSSVYILYAYDTGDGTLVLIKYDKYYKPDISMYWDRSKSGSADKMWGFEGPVENVIQSQIALDQSGDIYVIQGKRRPDNEFEQSIVKFRSNGIKDTSFDLRPESLTDPGQMFVNRYFKNAKFNGIYIRNDNLYVTWTGTEIDSNGDVIPQAYNSKFIKYANISTQSGIIKGGIDLMPGVLHYFGNNGISSSEPSEEIFSFVVDDNDNHYTLFRHNAQVDGSVLKNRGILMKYEPGGNSTDINLYSSFFLSGVLPTSFRDDSVTGTANFIHREVNDYPSLCIDSDNNIFISNGIRVCRIVSQTVASTLDYSIKDYSFNTIKTSLETATSDKTANPPRIPIFFPWDCCILTTSQDGNMFMIIEKYKLINLGSISKIMSATTTYKNIIYNRLDPPIASVLEKGLESDPLSVTLGIDFVSFDGLYFENCQGHEIVTLEVDPLPNLVSSDTIQKIMKTTVNLIRTTQQIRVELPLMPNLIIFQPNTDYTISLKLNDNIIYTHPNTLRVDMTTIHEYSILPYINTDTPGFRYFTLDSTSFPPTRILEIEDVRTGSITPLLLKDNLTEMPDGKFRLRIKRNFFCVVNTISPGYHTIDTQTYSLKIRYPMPYNLYFLRFKASLYMRWEGDETRNRITVYYTNTSLSSRSQSWNNPGGIHPTITFYPLNTASSCE